MSREDTDERNRRNVLKAIAGGAVGATTLAGAASAASSDGEVVAAPEDLEPDRVVEDVSEIDQDCWACTTYNECRDSCYVGSGIWTQELYQRTCCICGGDTVCTDWQGTGKCCPEE